MSLFKGTFLAYGGKMNVAAQDIAQTAGRKGRKYAQVVEAARRVFLTGGYATSSVDEIARAAEVSKATLYSYFPDKQHLFTEVARIECERMADETLAAIDPTAPVADVLEMTAERLARFLLSPFGLSIFRVCVAEAERFPDLAQQFYENGPKLGRSRLGLYLNEAVLRGELKIEDIDMAADQFAELCRAGLWPRALLGIQTEFDDQEISRLAKATARMFIARYGV